MDAHFGTTSYQHRPYSNQVEAVGLVGALSHVKRVATTEGLIAREQARG
jgi:hypothetical protein